VIDIAVEHWDPEIAARLANAVGDAYMERNAGFRQGSTSGAVKWLARQLDELKSNLELSEKSLYEFKKNKDLLAVSLADQQSLLGKQIQMVASEVIRAQLKRLAISVKLVDVKDGIADPLKVSSLSDFDTLVIRKLRGAMIEHQMQYEVLRERYLEKHPMAVAQKARLDAARRSLEREILNVVKAITADYKQASRHESRLSGTLQHAKTQAHDVNKLELDYRQLERKAQNAKELYTMVLRRLKESDLSANLNVNNVRVIDYAEPSWGPVYPRVQLNLIVGGLLGLMLGIGFAFLLAALDSTIKSLEDAEAVRGLLCLGFIPSIPLVAGQKKRKPTELAVHLAPSSATAESCRSIRTNLQFASPDKPLKRIVVTSPGPEEGKTTSAVSLAITMAQAGNRVLIIDADMRRPQLHRVFGVPRYEGLSTALSGEISPEQAAETLVKTTDVPNLFTMPCGPTPPNPAELCQSDRLGKLLDHLCDGFDWVILDSPPLLTVTDPVLLGAKCDGTILVARTGQTPKASLQAAKRTLADVGTNVLGVILNDLDLAHHSYYRYLRYRYYAYGYYRSKERESA
jgi:capsular exopolysaccharide synthesis family protein